MKLATWLYLAFGGTMVLGSSIACSPSSSEDEAAPVRPLVEVKVTEAELRDLALTVEAPATIHPRAVAQLAARVTAPIRSLGARKGDRVDRDKVLATLDDRDLLAQMADAEAALEQTQEIYERRKFLFEEGAIPERDLVVSKAEFERARAHVELIQAQVAFTELKSPFAGVVTEQFLYPGDMAKPDSPIFAIMDVSVVVARAQVPQSEVGAVKVDQRAVFVPADPTGELPDGRIRVVSANADPARRTVEVWCEIANADGRLHPGTFGSLRIHTGTAPASVVVPSSAVELQEGSRNGSVLVVDENRIAHRRSVVCGESVEDLLQIVEGLEAGETVVVEGGYGLPDGTLVEPIVSVPAEEAERP